MIDIESNRKCHCCGVTEEYAKGLISFSSVELGSPIYICSDCSISISEMFRSNLEYKHFEKTDNYPSKIKEVLDEYVIGQDEAKKVLSVELYKHFKRIQHPTKHFRKSNILLIGDSGTGKTLLVQTIAKMLDIPMTIADMSLITAAGYVGGDVETVLQQLVIAADNDIQKAQYGIIFLDEIDKIAKRNLSSSTDKDPGGEGVQQSLLKILEGSKVKIKVEGLKEKNQFIDTSNILFICAGAFFGLDKILETNHSKNSKSIGFSANVEKEELSEIEINEEDIIGYGFIPEFVGRLPVIVQTKKLSKEDLKRILFEPKDSIISQYIDLLQMDNIDLQISDEFLDSIVESAISSKRGARALQTEIEKKLRDIIYDINSSEPKSISL